MAPAHDATKLANQHPASPNLDPHHNADTHLISPPQSPIINLPPNLRHLQHPQPRRDRHDNHQARRARVSLDQSVQVHEGGLEEGRDWDVRGEGDGGGEGQGVLRCAAPQGQRG